MRNNVKRFRKARNLSRADLASKADTTERYIAFIEDGQRNPSLAMAIRIARVLGVSVDALF